MGSGKRPRPERLPEKLIAIRTNLDGGLSQNEMIRKLGLEGQVEQERISKYERGILEPPWFVLCSYADAANIWLEVLVKDEIDLPEQLPSKIKSEGIRLVSKELNLTRFSD
jgi:transcriptional regulator with XRE-family HTH domain